MRAPCLLLFCLLFFTRLAGQDSLINSIPGRYLSQVSQKSRQFEKQVDNRTSKEMDRMLKQEQKLHNYNTPFENMRQLSNVTLWTRSALLGISKKYKINNKLKGNIILLYDFLANQQVPRTDPVKFRLGYSF